MEEEVKQQPPQIVQQHIDIDENDQNLDMLVGGMAGGGDQMGYGNGQGEQAKKKKGKKKKKKARNNIEVIDDMGQQAEPPIIE
jgi:hypothetical protein